MARGSLAQGYQITTSETTAYQTPADLVKTLIQSAKVVNTGAGVATIDIWITPDGSTVTSDALKVVSSKQVGVNDTPTVLIELIGEYVNTQGKVIVQSDIVGVSLWLNGNTFKTEV